MLIFVRPVFDQAVRACEPKPHVDDAAKCIGAHLEGAPRGVVASAGADDLLAKKLLVLAGFLQLVFYGSGRPAFADDLEFRGGALTDTARQNLFHLLEQDAAKGTQLAL